MRNYSRIGSPAPGNADALNILIEQWTQERKTLDLFREAQAHRIPAAPVNTMANAYADEQLASRQFCPAAE